MPFPCLCPSKTQFPHHSFIRKKGLGCRCAETDSSSTNSFSTARFLFVLSQFTISATSSFFEYVRTFLLHPEIRFRTDHGLFPLRNFQSCYNPPLEWHNINEGNDYSDYFLASCTLRFWNELENDIPNPFASSPVIRFRTWPYILSPSCPGCCLQERCGASLYDLHCLRDRMGLQSRLLVCFSCSSWWYSSRRWFVLFYSLLTLLWQGILSILEHDFFHRKISIKGFLFLLRMCLFFEARFIVKRSLLGVGMRAAVPHDVMDDEIHSSADCFFLLRSSLCCEKIILTFSIHEIVLIWIVSEDILSVIPPLFEGGSSLCYEHQSLDEKRLGYAWNSQLRLGMRWCLRHTPRLVHAHVYVVGFNVRYA